MNASTPLPAPLLHAPFTVRDVEKAGLTRSRLRSRDVVGVRPGVYAPAGRMPHPVGLAQAVARADPHAVICSVTAARWMGVRLPQRFQTEEAVRIARTDGRDRSRRRWVVATTASYRPGEVLMRDGVRVTTPARTFLDLARVLTEEELIIAGDGLICAHRHGPLAGRPPLCTLDQLREIVQPHSGDRGVRRCRTALERLRVGSDSAPETVLRLRLEEFGITGLLLDVRIDCPDGGTVLPDLWHEEARLSIQYNGVHHSDPAQISRDVERNRRTRAAGAEELRIMHRDMTTEVVFRGQRVIRAVQLVVEAIETRTGRRGW